jgi:hypothetical protein
MILPTCALGKCTFDLWMLKGVDNVFDGFKFHFEELGAQTCKNWII